MGLCPEFVCKLDKCNHKRANCKDTCLIALDIYKCSACLIRGVFHCSDSLEDIQEERKKYNDLNS